MAPKKTRRLKSSGAGWVAETVERLEQLAHELEHAAKAAGAVAANVRDDLAEALTDGFVDHAPKKKPRG